MQDFNEIELKLSNTSIASHALYIKPHKVREKVAEKPSNKTLFVVGIPPFCNEVSLKELFSTFGTVNNVYLHKAPSSQVPPKEESKYFPKYETPKGFKIGYIVFQKESHVKKAMEWSESLIFPSDLIVTGIQKWSQEYNNSFPDQKELEEEIKSYMENFDKETNNKLQMEKDLLQPQKDGWITVTRKGRNPGFARKESVANHLKQQGEKQRKQKELKNFYTFQIKESKMKNLVALRKKFEEDKRKIAALKEVRRFKPF